MYRVSGISRWVCGFAFLLLLTSGSSGDGMSAAPDQLMALAESQVRAGKPAEAAKTYEEFISLNPQHRPVVAGILVRLYAEAGNSGKAMEWARVVMETTPDPQAYLSGVYSLSGNHREAIRILQVELEPQPSAERAIPLYWQLADEYEKLGDVDSAEQALNQAAEAAAGSPRESAARARLIRFRTSHSR